MSGQVKTFYYSRKKLGLYLLFNILLLSLAILFTLSIFPEYPLVYYFAIGSSLLSLVGALLVFIIPFKLAVLTPEFIKIDHCEPLKWTDIRKVNKIKIDVGLHNKTILKLETKKLKNYHLNFMQKLICNSQFGAFSIPLYAMSNNAALEIEREIRKQHAAIKPHKKKYTDK